MLEWLRKYQRYIFIIVTAMVIASFSFFGAYGTFADAEKRVDKVISHTIDGAPVNLTEVKQLAHFLSTDREDHPDGRAIPNWLNDGVIRYDFLRTRLADILVAAYFEPLKNDLQARLSAAKRYRPYTHPDAPFLSARLVWDRVLPGFNQELEALQKEEGVSPSVFSHLSQLYQQQSFLPAEMLRRILTYQHQQYSWLKVDQRLMQEDLSLFGYHTAVDWFGRDFVDLVAQFILNAAAAAAEKGYQVSLEEAKGDLIHHFHQSMEKLKKEISYAQHLRMLGFDEKIASELWRKVLLFRRYFQDVGEATFVDHLPFKGFGSYAHETAIVHTYEWPISLASDEDLFHFQAYIKAVGTPSKDPLAIPDTFKSVDEVAEKYPALVQTVYKAKVVELTKAQIGLRASLKEVWDWEMKSWPTLKKEFSFLPAAASFQNLEALSGEQRAKIDAVAREALVDLNPNWIEEALLGQEGMERTLPVSGATLQLPHVEKSAACASLLMRAAGNDPDAVVALKNYCDDGKTFFRFDSVEQVKERHILTFKEARGVLKAIAEKEMGKDLDKALASVFAAIGAREKRFAHAMEKAYQDLQKNPNDPSWVGETGNPIADQFKIRRQELSLQRTSQEDWMKEQAFLLVPNQWSPIHIPIDGNVVFFYLEDKKPGEPPLLEQMKFGKETLSADAKRYLAERLLEASLKKHAIVLPVQGETE